MRLRLVILLCMLLAGCIKETVQPTFCYECHYHDQIWHFCDMTAERMDSIRGVFDHNGCDQDTLVCNPL